MQQAHCKRDSGRCACQARVGGRRSPWLALRQAAYRLQAAAGQEGKRGGGQWMSTLKAQEGRRAGPPGEHIESSVPGPQKQSPATRHGRAATHPQPSGVQALQLLLGSYCMHSKSATVRMPGARGGRQTHTHTQKTLTAQTGPARRPSPPRAAQINRNQWAALGSTCSVGGCWAGACSAELGRRSSSHGRLSRSSSHRWLHTCQTQAPGRAYPGVQVPSSSHPPQRRRPACMAQRCVHKSNRQPPLLYRR